MKQFVILLTGISGSGKTTIANILKDILENNGIPIAIVDGDVSRKRIGNIFGHDKESRHKMAKVNYGIGEYLLENNLNVIYALVAPFESVRYIFRNLNNAKYIEIYIKTSWEICKERDVKGMYKKAISGDIKNFNGTNDGFEEPIAPDLVIDTGECTPSDAANGIVDFLKHNHYI